MAEKKKVATKKEEEVLVDPEVDRPEDKGQDAPSDIRPYKVSKIMVWPSRKISLGNYNTVDLNAGIEIVFDEPMPVDSQAVKDAFVEARRIIREEFKKQYEPYVVKKS